MITTGPGETGSLRRTATDDGTPAVTVEMRKTHRSQPTVIDRALDGVASLVAAIDRGEFDGYRQRGLRWRGESPALD